VNQDRVNFIRSQWEKSQTRVCKGFLPGATEMVKEFLDTYQPPQLTVERVIELLVEYFPNPTKQLPYTHFPTYQYVFWMHGRPHKEIDIIVSSPKAGEFLYSDKWNLQTQLSFNEHAVTFLQWIADNTTYKKGANRLREYLSIHFHPREF